MLAIVPLGPAEPAGRLMIGERTVLDLVLRRLLDAALIERVVLALDGVTAAAALGAIADASDRDRIACATGVDRLRAIAAALDLAGPSTHVLLHPPDRPLGPAATIDDLVRDAGEADVTALSQPVRSTLKRVSDGWVVATVPRDAWRATPGPWLFRRAVLDRTLASAATDQVRVIDGLDLVRSAGLDVRWRDADPADLRIRTAADARFAERWLATARVASARLAGP